MDGSLTRNNRKTFSKNKFKYLYFELFRAVQAKDYGSIVKKAVDCFDL